MAISGNLRDNVSRRDLSGVRDALFMATMKDPGFAPDGAFDEAMEFCLANGILRAELFESDDGGDIPEEITVDNLARICASLRVNFSERRLAAAKKMGAALYPVQSKGCKSATLLKTGACSPKKVLAATLIASVVVFLLIVIIRGCVKRERPKTPSKNRSAEIATNVVGVWTEGSTNKLMKLNPKKAKSQEGKR